ncbi:capsule assembly Wzi family protein [Acinetobacter schindleri]|uniref:capsule assembly Wzi family protein n=1 Tax=Acinetobacter schindleri TaxID=108981 RepID=UPI0022F397B7|nr:capsule assembly Wzi family protein [Acinetobacter schindleri]MDP1444384.1 capsule assembly Wzi family protein [Acinetobacter schindleri]WBX38175.1 capsule assembly Wzi family protein [Acinetobacter schindleri]
MRLSKILLATLALSSSLTFAQGIVLNDQNLRTDLNWLNQQGVIQISTSTWPMSGDEIQRALSQAKISTPVQQKVVDAVLTHLNADNQLLKAALFAETDHKYLPQAFGDQEKSQYQAGLELNAGGSQWDARLRVNAEKDPQIDHDQDVNVEGSYIAGKLWNQWLIAGQIPIYWGPGHEGSLIRGDASRPVYGITAQRAEQTAFSSKWLSWIGPWQYQAFAGQLDNYDAVPDAKLIGLRVTAQPLPYLELGASRAIQWGGEGRPESLSSLWDAFVGNKDNGGTGEPDPSNQIAGFDARLNLQPLVQMPLGIYAQYVGEDEAGGLPAKKMYLAGVDYSSSYQNMPYQLYSEWADTRTNGKAQGISYNHSVYTDGFYQHGYPLAHAMGGDGQMISVGGDIRFDPLNRLHGRVLFAKLNGSGRITNAAFPEQDELTALDITWTHYLRPDIPLKLNGWISNSDLYGNDGGASIRIEFPLEKGLFSY